MIISEPVNSLLNVRFYNLLQTTEPQFYVDFIFFHSNDSKIICESPYVLTDAMRITE